MIDVELFLRDWLAATFPECRVVTEIPADLADVLPVIQVVKFGGTTIGTGFERAIVDIDTFSGPVSGDYTGRNASRKLAERVRDGVLSQLPGYTADGATVTGCLNTGAPGFRAYDNTLLRRFGATYFVYVKPSR